MRWYDSADYKAAKNLRHSSATSRVILVEVVQAAYNRNRSSPVDPDWGAGRSLTSLPGIGPFFTVLQRYEVDDMTRFRSAKKFACYTGSSPLHASNARVPQHPDQARATSGYGGFHRSGGAGPSGPRTRFAVTMVKSRPSGVPTTPAFAQRGSLPSSSGPYGLSGGAMKIVQHDAR